MILKKDPVDPGIIMRDFLEIMRNILKIMRRSQINDKLSQNYKLVSQNNYILLVSHNFEKGFQNSDLEMVNLRY